MNVQEQIDRLIALQAAQWYEHLVHGSGENGAGFTRWVAESPRHMEAFLVIASEAPLIRKTLLAGMASGQFDLGKLLNNTPAVVQRLSISVDRPAIGDLERRSARFAPSWLAAAAAVAVLAVASLILFKSPAAQHFETPTGEQRTIQLTESSVVNLNTQSRIEVRFDKAARVVHLLQGEATFKVAPDRARPFRVQTRDALIEAVGTQFNVYARPDGSTAVATLEGKVRVATLHNGSTQHSVALEAGEEATARPDGRIDRTSHADVAEAIAWQRRVLIFKRTSLEEIVAEFNRYNRSTTIRLEGIDPDSLRFSGVFNADDPQSLASLLAHEPDLLVENRPGEIVIRPRARGGLPEAQ